jgi:hypothetical protein
METGQRTRWIDYLEDEDLAFVKRFLLFSGSLKDLAQAYDVSYPTLRLRLDRLIQKIKVLDDRSIEDSFERLLRARFAEGKIEAGAFKGILAAYKKQMQSHEKNRSD